MIKDVYMVDRIDDYVVSFVYPNVHFILDSGEELQAPIYSPRMYDFCRGSDVSIIEKIDKLYAEFLESLKNMNADDSFMKHLMEIIKSNKEYARLLGL